MPSRGPGRWLATGHYHRCVRPSLFAACLAAVTSLLLAGCSGGSDPDAPAGAELLARAADEMAQVTTVAIEITSDVDVADLPVRRLTGVVTREGEAEGAAQVDVGQRLELRFVVVDETFYFRLLGDWTELPLAQATQFYDPSAILDPDRGVANLLRTASDARVVEREDDQYRVTARFDPAALDALVPGASAPVEGTVWIGVERPVLHRAEFPIEASGQSGTVQVALSRFNEPVTIDAPR